jgi:hypothetical protein
MLSKIDASVISALRSEPWPQPGDYPAPATVAARTSSLKLVSSGVFALVLAAMIGVILRENALSAAPFEGWRLWLRIAAAAGIGVLGIVILGAGVHAVLQPRTLASLDAAGLRVPELFSETVPWSEVRAVLHDKPRVKLFGAGRILIGIRDGRRFGLLQGPEVQPAGAPGELDSAALPQMLDIPVDRLLAQIQAHRARYGQA